MLGATSDSIRIIAEDLIENARGIEWDLLSKSLQETLLFCTGIDLDLDDAEIKTRLVSFSATRGKFALIEQFLRFCIFNFVWFRIGDSFRIADPAVDAFERDMDSVERVCQRIVASTWRPYESRGHELDLDAAEELIHSIDAQLRGEPHESSRTQKK